jgi:hypothetical protein
MACLEDPFDGRRGLRAMAGSPASRGKGMGAAPTLSGVVQPKAATVVVDLQGQLPHDGGACLRGDGNVGQRLHVGAQQQDQ